MRQKILVGVVVVLTVAVAIVYLGSGEEAVDDRPGPRPDATPEQLVQTIEEAQTPGARERAAVQLARMGRPVVPQMRQVATRSREAPVRAATIQGLGDAYDYQSMEIMLDGLEDPSPLVRGRSHAAVVRMLGAGTDYDPTRDPRDQRQYIEFYREQWQAMRASPALRQFEQKLDRNFGEIP